ncbi:hypothetical protein LDENG_00136330 [Lucifuga dentata]|nr:hypothetical protein LDENG_00136330 [Lucifuga dentata]
MENHIAVSLQASSDTMTRTDHMTVSQPASRFKVSGSVATVNQTPSASNDDYTTYLSIIGSVSDHSSDDEELNQAIMASLESQM